MLRSLPKTLTYNSEDDLQISVSLTFWPRLQQAKLLKKTARLLIDEACVIEFKWLELVNKIMKWSRYSGAVEDDKPGFSHVSVVLCEDSLQLSPVLTSKESIENDDWEIRYVLVSCVGWTIVDVIALKIREHSQNFAICLAELEARISRAPSLCFYIFIFKSTYASISVYSWRCWGV